ncbi:MAG: hypothetical protein OEM26_17220 [Saprospiraceae bacterium]|nr:hypothetical protein [Saprospiraceae bacterium]
MSPSTVHRQSRRVLQIGYYTIRQVILMLSNALIALVVIRNSSAIEWGLFVKTLIIITLITHVAAWGNRDYLLQQFTLNAREHFSQFFTSILTRSTLLVPGAVILYWLNPESWTLPLMWLAAYFIYQSFDVLIVYERRFREAAIIDVLGLLCIVGPVIIGHSAEMMTIIKLYLASYLLRSILLIILFRGIFKNLVFKLDGLHIIAAFPFFIIGLSGLLQSRIDLYTISFFLSDEEVGIYQVLIGFLLAIQAGSAFLLTPFAKNIMRSRIPTVQRLASNTAKLGIVLVTAGIILTRFILSEVYQIELKNSFFVVGAFFALAPYMYLVRIYKLYGQKRENTVVIINLVAALLTMLLTLILIKKFGLFGALIAATVVQWLVVATYLTVSLKKST